MDNKTSVQENNGGLAFLKDYLDPNFNAPEYYRQVESDLTIRHKSEIFNYHAHVYYTLDRQESAKILYERVAQRFTVQMGIMYDYAAGPHCFPQFEIAFTIAEFPNLIPWLLLNHLGLSILIHTNTQYLKDDHLKTCFWIGKQLPLRGEKLPDNLKMIALDTPPEIFPNTTPTIFDN